MGTTRYATINGRIISQNKNGVYTRLLSDPLGNVIATMDASGVKTNDTTYWPYGEVRTGGVSAVTNLGFCGAWGYYTDASARLYVRARYYRPVLGRWQTKDPLWPIACAYLYGSNSPIARTDTTGLFPDYVGCSSEQKGKLSQCCQAASRLKDAAIRDDIKKCMEKRGYGLPSFSNGATVDFFLDLILRYCNGSNGSGKENRVCIRCASGETIPNWADDCFNPCKKDVKGVNYWAYTFPPDESSIPKDQCGLVLYNEDCPQAFDGTGGKKCSCSIVFCESGFSSPLQSPCAVLFHELPHCSGLGHVGGEPLPPGVYVPREFDFIYKLGCCVCTALKGASECGRECERVRK